MIERNRIYNMDCIDGMKLMDECSVDCVITSPPYNKHNKNGGRMVERVVYDTYVDDIDEGEYQEWQVRVLDECYRVLKDGGCVFYNHKNRYVDGDMISPIEWIKKTRFSIRQEIVWDRMIAGNIRGWRFWNVDERIYWLQKGSPVELHPGIAKKTSIWRIRPQFKNEFNHPCGFPVELAVNCIRTLQSDGGVILDPFMGSGTTAVAALTCGYDYIGFEISGNYCDMANERIRVEMSSIGTKLF